MNSIWSLTFEKYSLYFSLPLECPKVSICQNQQPQCFFLLPKKFSFQGCVVFYLWSKTQYVFPNVCITNAELFCDPLNFLNIILKCPTIVSLIKSLNGEKGRGLHRLHFTKFYKVVLVKG